jgi:SHS2 domain-containing protein
MPWRYLDDRAIADVAFSATGETLEELFHSSVDALVNAMVYDLFSIAPREEREIQLSAEGIGMLLFELLKWVIISKDTEGLLLRIESVRIAQGSGNALPLATLTAVLRGERIDPMKHKLVADVKAVSLYRYRVEEVQDGWEAEVVLDA